MSEENCTRREVGRNSGGNVSFDTDRDLRDFIRDTSKQLAGLTSLLALVGGSDEYDVVALREVVQDMTWQMEQAVELAFPDEVAHV